MPGPVTRSDLLDYPRPSLAVDVALLTVDDGDDPHLRVVLQRPTSRPDGAPGTAAWGLPGSVVRAEERVEDAVVRTLLTKCGMQGVAARQIGLFDTPGRDPRGWVVSAAHVATVSADAVAQVAPHRHDVVVVPVRQDHTGAHADLPAPQQALPYDHQLILEAAVADLRERYDREPDPDQLLGATFTLRQLRQVHRAVEGSVPTKDTFNRRMAEAIERTDETLSGSVGRPATLFRRRTDGERPPISLRVSGRVTGPRDPER